jgi:hypothetical protein
MLSDRSGTGADRSGADSSAAAQASVGDRAWHRTAGLESEPAGVAAFVRANQGTLGGLSVIWLLDVNVLIAAIDNGIPGAIVIAG